MNSFIRGLNMADSISKEQRSKNMAAICSKDTKPEQYIRKQLFSKGFRYRKNTNLIIGHPDIFLKKYNTAIFVHGCFWHRHSYCKYCYMPHSNRDYWETKFENNIKRDDYVKSMLKEQGIKCLIIWECTVKKMKKDKNINEFIIERIVEFLKGDNLFEEI